jgi:hypothetical protein
VTIAQKWMLETIMRYLWMCAHGRLDWDGTRALKYLDIAVAKLPKLEVEATRLRLWQSDYKTVIDHLSTPERQEIIMHLNANPREPVYCLNDDASELTRGAGITPSLIGVANKVLEKCQDNRVREEVGHAAQ